MPVSSFGSLFICAVAFALVVPSVGLSRVHDRFTTRLRQTYLVTNAGDFGPGTLRQAILDANVNPGPDTIAFRIEGEDRTIRPSTPLPEISDPVVVDGTTQSGYAGRPLVEIDGTGAGDEVDGIVISAGSSTVRALVVNGFRQHGIVLRSKGGNRVAGCYVGTTADGTAARGNENGVYVDSSTENEIGGLDPADRNIISGNRSFGVAVFTASSPTEVFNKSLIRGNYIGTDASGTAAVPNEIGGVLLESTAGVTVGGTDPGAGNVISGNGGSQGLGGGIHLDFARSASAGDGQIVIQGNRIGTGATGERPLGNRGSGVVFDRSSAVVGGREPGAANVIAHNGGSGVYFPTAGGAVVLSNAIFANEEGGIIYRGGTPAVAPAITFVSTGGGQVRVQGGYSQSPVEIPGYRYLFQFFANDECAPDAFAGQGERFLGEIEAEVDASGAVFFDATFPGSIPPGGALTATATDLDFYQTSRFSVCVADTNGCARPFVTTRPMAADVRPGERATLSVEASGSEPLSYQWYRIEGTGPVAIAGATGRSYTTPPLAERVRYRVVVSGQCGESEADVTVSVCAAPPVITMQPVDQIVAVGKRAALQVLEQAPGTYTYQWYRGEGGDTNDPIEGATSRFHRPIVTNEPATYWVRVTSGCGSVDSTPARVVPGPIVDSVRVVSSASGKPQLVIEGSGFASSVFVSVDGIGFVKAAVVKNGARIVQKGKLANALSIKKAIPPGRPVTVTVTNQGADSASVTYTR